MRFQNEIDHALAGRIAIAGRRLRLEKRKAGQCFGRKPVYPGRPVDPLSIDQNDRQFVRPTGQRSDPGDEVADRRSAVSVYLCRAQFEFGSDERFAAASGHDDMIGLCTRQSSLRRRRNGVEAERGRQAEQAMGYTP
ncbi:MAG: hypothetical protein IE932_10680 [Sphingopyxis terrae]|nr:hypothetical protein [Sphingopyxis terrae]